MGEVMKVETEDVIREEKETIERYKESIILFFRNYVSALGQLQPQDRIAVLIRLEDWQSLDSENSFLSAWISKQDIDRYRRNELNDSDFVKRIHFQLTDTETDIDTDITILSEIFDRAMNLSTYWGRLSSSGVYLDGFGALFFMELPNGCLTKDAFSFVISSDRGNAVAYSINGQKMKAQMDRKKKTEEESLQEVQDTLFEVMASYGHTLRLKPQEWIVLEVNVGGKWFLFDRDRQSPSHLIFKLKKKDLDDYNRSMISLSDLRNKLVQHTY
jgi:hypothetical protein